MANEKTFYPEWKTKKSVEKLLAENANGQYSNYSSRVNARMAELYQLYGNTDYWQKFMSNPSLNLPDSYSNIKLTGYNANWYADLMAEYEKSALTNIDQLVGNIREEGYNSAAAQAARERVAGINPDLAGNVDPGSAAEYDDQAGAFDIPSMNDAMLAKRAQSMQVADQVFSTISGTVTSAIAMASQFEGLEGMKASNISQRLSNYDTASNYIVKLIASRLPVPKDSTKNPFESPYLVPGDDPDDPFNEKNFGATVLGAAEKIEKEGIFKNYHRKDRKILQSAYNQFIQPLRAYNGQVPAGLASEYWKNIRDYVSGRTESIQGYGKTYWKEDFSSSVQSFFSDFGSIQTDVYKALSDLQSS